MRIIGGQHRGVPLAHVGKGDAAAHLRPTTDRIRETLFNILQGGRFGDVIEGAQVLDLFAGTGALGFEALSRGSAHVTFIDSGRIAQKLIAQNIQTLNQHANCTRLTCPAERLPKASTPCTLIFLDPPYGKALTEPSLITAKRTGWIAPDALIVCEDRVAINSFEGFQCEDQRRYGQTWLSFLSAT